MNCLPALSVLLLSALPLWSDRPSLSFEQRVAAQEAVERILYAHRTWPNGNSSPKPPFEAMVPRAMLEAKVGRYLKESAALERFWARPLSRRQLQAEMERMVRDTRDPALLRELFAALGNDPELIAECLARPVLSGRLLRAWFAADDRFQGEVRARAMAAMGNENWERAGDSAGGERQRFRCHVSEGAVDPGGSPPDDPQLSEQQFAAQAALFPRGPWETAMEETADAFILRRTLRSTPTELEGEVIVFAKSSPEAWLAAMVPDRAALHAPVSPAEPRVPYLLSKFSGPIGGFQPDSWMQEDYFVAPRSRHKAVWTGTEMIVWGGWSGSAYLNTGGRYDPALDDWKPVALTNAPEGRDSHTAVWTGSEMIVWGGIGFGGVYLNSGGRYDPALDIWTTVSSGTNCPTVRALHTAVWTGTEMIVWGGYYYDTSGHYQADGARYRPETNTWVAVSAGPLAGRNDHSAIWTGRHMIVWGGTSGVNVYENTGGIYNPDVDTWSATATLTAPAARRAHTAVWNGDQMIVWGGSNAGGNLNTGSRYNPTLNFWAATDTGDADCPTPRTSHAAVWTGTEMIIWGGLAGAATNSGSRYDPQLNTWSPVSTVSAPSARYEHSALWTGDEMIIWGGIGASRYNSGGRYAPLSDLWVPIASAPGPSARSRHTAVWTGTEMIVWGGQSPTMNTGSRYIPALDAWTALSVTSVPEARYAHTAVWTGTYMVVWGGHGSSGFDLNTGGRYRVSDDTWLGLNTGGAPAARMMHTAVWTGARMIVWGGQSNGSSNKLNSGGQYDPEGNGVWSATDTASPNTPSARDQHSAVWTGSEMIVWGGSTPAAANTGGRYEPVGNTWLAVDAAGAQVPTARYDHAAVWTGSRMLIWGGYGTGMLNTGAQYDPLTDAWSAMSGLGAPTERRGASAVWTGLQMIVWGGNNGSPLNSGGRYTPSLDDGIRTPWEATSTPDTPPARYRHSAVWTGREMVVWGGTPEYSLGVYYTNTRPTASAAIFNADATIRLGDGLDLALGHTLPPSFLDDVEGTEAWIPVGNWHRVYGQNCTGIGDFVSPVRAWYSGDSASCDYVGWGLPGSTTLTLSSAVPVTSRSVLTFRYFLSTDLAADDSASVGISCNDGSSWQTVAGDQSHWESLPADAVLLDDRCTAWKAASLSIASFAPGCASALVRFTFQWNALFNAQVGWLLDDIGIGDLAGDGSNPCLGFADSQGNDPGAGTPYHDTWDRPFFAWDLDGDGVADNPSDTSPFWDIPEADLEAHGLAVPGDHDLDLTVTDSRGFAATDTITLHVEDGVEPSVAVTTPDGGESWAYSESVADRKQHLIVWGASDNFPPLGRVKLSYSTDGGTSWTCIADTKTPGGDCDAGGLTVDDPSFWWAMPTQAEAGAAVPPQVFPSALARIRVDVEDTSGNAAFDASGNNFYIIQPTTTAIKTLVAWHPGRIAASYGAPAQASLGLKLAELADHAKVAGVVLDLSTVSAVTDAYAAWDADTPPTDANPDLANAVASAIRTYLLDQANNTYTNTQYVILVGDDAQVPLYRMTDGTSIYPESVYDDEVGLSTTTTVGSALSRNYFLTDNYFGELTPEASGMVAPHAWIYLDDFAVGRLVETPGQMEGVINTFLAQDGQVNITTAADEVLVTGFDFLYDSAADIKTAWQGAGKTTDSLLDDPAVFPGDEYTPAQLKDALFNTPPIHKVTNVNTHANHFSWAASTGGLTTTQMEQAPTNDLTGTVLYTSGCHSGLPVPAADPNPLDLPEAMAKKKVAAYIGNTGYGWGMKHGKGLTESLMEKISSELLTAGSLSMGKALAQAKRNYVLQEKRWDVFDEKVVHELSLFGIPNYLVVTRTQGFGAEAAETTEAEGLRRKAEGITNREQGTIARGQGAGDQGQRTTDQERSGEEGLPPPDGPDKGCAEGICLTKSLKGGGEGLLPSGVTALDLNFTFGPGTYTLATTADGSYYKLNNRASGEVGDAVQPLFIYNSYLSGTNAHGILFTGGVYTSEGSFNPVTAVPYSTNYQPGGEGQLPAGSTWTPSVRASFGTSGGLGMRAIGQTGYTNMTVHTGFYTAVGQTESRFGDMQFVIYYSNAVDVIPPAVTDPGAGGFHTLNGLTASFSATVGDLSSVYRVIVTYNDQRTAQWKSFDLTNAGGNVWTGTLGLKGDIVYYVQAVDNSGNVGMLAQSGSDLAPGGTPYGSTWAGPKTYSILLPDADADTLPDAYEDLHPACLNKTTGGQGVLDPDYDYLTNANEFAYDTDPCDGDSDGGGENDGSERNANGTNPKRNPLSQSDDRHLTIQMTKINETTYTIDWPAAQGDNGIVDGAYFVYRSDTPFFDPADRIATTPDPLPDGTDTWTDGGCAAPVCYYNVWNYALDMPAPVVEAVAPGTGFQTGNLSVSIYGDYFSNGAAVTFCDAPATNVVVVNAAKITCRTPAYTCPSGPPCTCTVKVTNPNGQEGTLAGGFTYQ